MAPQTPVLLPRGGRRHGNAHDYPRCAGAGGRVVNKNLPRGLSLSTRERQRRGACDQGIGNPRGAAPRRCNTRLVRVPSEFQARTSDTGPDLLAAINSALIPGAVLSGVDITRR
jgi:hypothetical protein